MTQGEILESILNEVETRIREQHSTVTYLMIREIFLQVVNDLQYKIIPASINAPITNIADFQRIISQNISHDIEPDDVYGEQLLKQLVYEGWVVIPPV